MAAATARQKSTSKPVQAPRSSTAEKPGKPSLTPQMSEPALSLAPASAMFQALGEPIVIARTAAATIPPIAAPA